MESRYRIKQVDDRFYPQRLTFFGWMYFWLDMERWHYNDIPKAQHFINKRIQKKNHIPKTTIHEL